MDEVFASAKSNVDGTVGALMERSRALLVAEVDQLYRARRICSCEYAICGLRHVYLRIEIYTLISWIVGVIS